MVKRIAAGFLFLVTLQTQAKVLIMTHNLNRPDFIEIQDKTFKRFLEDDYEFVVFNDAKDQLTRTEIGATCKRLGLQCIDIPQEIHGRPYLHRLPGEDYNSANVRCANVVQYSLDTLGFKHNGIVFIIDSDMFLIKKFSITRFMENYDLAGIDQIRAHVHYLWNGLVFLNMQTLPDKEQIDFNCCKIDGIATDVGGRTYYYLKSRPNVRVFYINQIYPGLLKCSLCGHDNGILCAYDEEKLKAARLDADFISSIKKHINKLEPDLKLFKFILADPDNMELDLNATFLHYRAGGNWDYRSAQYHQRKTKVLNDFISDLLMAD